MENETITQLFGSRCAEQGMLVSMEGEEISFQALVERSRRLCAELAQQGVKPGQRIAIFAEYGPHWVTLLLATLLSGAATIPLDCNLSAEEISRRLALTEPSLILVDEESQHLPDNYKQLAFCTDPNQRYHTAESASQSVELQPDSIALLVFSSGTGGEVKAIEISHSSLHKVIAVYMNLFEQQQVSRILSILPLAAIYPTAIALAVLAAGGTVVFSDPTDKNLIQKISTHKLEMVPAVPLFVEGIWQSISDAVAQKGEMERFLFQSVKQLLLVVRRYTGLNLGRALFGSIHHKFGKHFKLVLSGGAALSKTVLREMYSLGFTVYEGYGLTETAGLVTTRLDDYRAFGSVGKPTEDVEIVLSKSPENLGEVMIRSERVLRRYHRNPEATEKALDNGWLKTGDVGRYDAEGNLYIIGRLKEVIVLPDETKHFPAEFEAWYRNLPGVRDYAVVGAPSSDRSGDAVCIAIVTNETESQQAIIKRIKEKVTASPPNYQVHCYLFMDQIPKNQLGKVCRSAIADRASEWQSLQPE